MRFSRYSDILKLRFSNYDKDKLLEEWDLIRLYNDIYLDIGDNNELHRRNFKCFLFAVAETNQAQLVKELTSARFKSYNSLQDTLVSLSIAVSFGNREVVEVFLNLSSSFYLLEKSFGAIPFLTEIRNMHRMRNIDGTVCLIDELSVIECACLCDQRDVLKLLLAYERDHKRSGRVQPNDTLFSIVVCRCSGHACPDTYRYTTALHEVIQLVRNDRFRRMLTLPTIVRLMLDAGIDVNELYRKKYTPLFLLINQTIDLYIQGVDLSTDECNMIVETARVLLASGSVTTGWKGIIKIYVPLEELIDVYFNIVDKFLLSTSTAANVNNNNNMIMCEMISDLMKLLLEYGALNTYTPSSVPFDDILQRTVFVAFKYMNQYQNHDAALVQRFDMIAENLSGLFNYFLLTDANIMSHFALLTAQVGSHNGHYSVWFVFLFIFIAGFSFERGNSNKLLRLMSNGLRASQINALKMFLARYSTDIINLFSIPDVYRLKALEWISSVVPFSLQCLSSRAVTRAMSYRCLDARNVLTLSLPKQIREYIGYNYVFTS